jgi:hypothetical protein
LSTLDPGANDVRTTSRFGRLVLTISAIAVVAGCGGDPEPTPAPIDSAAHGCVPRPSACGFPDGTNSGVPAGAALMVVTGDVALTTPGQVYEGQDVHGCVEVHADNVTIKNSRISGAGCQYALHNQATGLTIVDSEINCADTAHTAIGSSDLTATRVDVHGCENGFNVSGRVTVEDSWVHDLYAPAGAHTDGAQLNQGAESVVFEHNTILSPLPGGTAAIIMWNEGDPQNRDVTISGNLLAGGAWTLYCPRSDTTGVRVVGNRISPGGFGPAAACTAGHVAEFTDNIADDTGTALSP